MVECLYKAWLTVGLFDLIPHHPCSPAGWDPISRTTCWWHMPNLAAALNTPAARMGSVWRGSIITAWLYSLAPAWDQASGSGWGGESGLRWGHEIAVRDGRWVEIQLFGVMWTSLW